MEQVKEEEMLIEQPSVREKSVRTRKIEKVEEELTEEEKKFVNLPILGKPPANTREEKYLREIAEYEYNNLEEASAKIQFPYGSTKHKINLILVPGVKYRLPRHVARHIESCSTPIYKWKATGTGTMEKSKVGMKSRFQMRPLFT